MDALSLSIRNRRLAIVFSCARIFCFHCSAARCSAARCLAAFLLDSALAGDGGVCACVGLSAVLGPASGSFGRVLLVITFGGVVGASAAFCSRFSRATSPSDWP